MTKRKALGSGLDSLLSSTRRVTESETPDQPQPSSPLPVHKIVRNRHQPRKVFHENEIKQLADSINENGQISPIVVRKMGEKFELIVGERRWRATQLLKKDTIDAVIIDADEKTSAVLSIVENVQREDLNSMEEAESLLRLVSEFGMSHDDVSKYISKSRTHVTNLIRLNELSDYDNIFLFGVNIKSEYPILSIRFNEAVKSGTKIYSFHFSPYQEVFPLEKSYCISPKEIINKLK